MHRGTRGMFAAVLTAAMAATASAEEIVCVGTLGAVTVDNVRVPDGARCKLKSTRVLGTVKVERGAKLAAYGIRVVGNVQAENAAEVRILKSTVGGSIQLKQGGRALVHRTALNGDLQFDANAGTLAASNNVIGGSLQAFQNRGGLTIKKNEIDGNLQCKENAPAPRGGRNVVHGNAEDQCAALGGGSGGGGSGSTPPPSGGGGGTTPPPPSGGCSYGAVTLGDDFEIPAGVSCAMNGTRVQGSIKLNRNASLDARNIFVDGNIQAQDAAGIRVVDSEVRGSIQFEQGGFADVRGTIVTGSLQLFANDGTLVAGTNRINGDLQAFRNRGGAAITFTDNRIGGNLQCKENAPAPGGGNNRVDGNKEDQCARL